LVVEDFGKGLRRAYETAVGTPQDRQRNALIVSMLAYAGLRPIDRGWTLRDALRTHPVVPDDRQCANPLQLPSGRCWARTSDLRLVEAALSQLS
jgi:hypothetical protein